MSEGKINQFVIRTREELDDVIAPHQSRNVSLVDEEIINCPHDKIYLRSGKDEEDVHSVSVHCTDCDSSVNLEITKDTLKDVLRGELESLGPFRQVD